MEFKNILKIKFNLIVGFVLASFFASINDCYAQKNTSGGKDYSPPALESEASWSAILLPDPQSYVKYERNQPLLELMTSWISENVETLNIKFVMCTGDLVDSNTLFHPDGIKNNQTSKEQWEAVSKAFSRLDGKVPYITTTGNHDYGISKHTDNRKTHFNEYFPVDKNSKNRDVLRDVGLNADGIPTLENASYEFTIPQGQKYLMLSLEFAPRNTIIEWAKKIVSREEYKDHIVGILTHYYLGYENEHTNVDKWALEDGNVGADIWEKLVKPSKNIQMVFAGHIGKANDSQGHIAFRQDKNSNGKNVQQMVFNAQGLGGGFNGNGGDGWLRILEFLPDGKTIRVKTFSPLFAISPSTNHLAWRKESYDEFTMILD